MKKLLILIFLLSADLYGAHAQTEVNGTIVSVNGEPIPLVSIDVSAIGPTNIFTLPEKSYAGENGEFSVTFNEPGIYTLTVRGVFHKSVRIPLVVYEQDQMSMTIYLFSKFFDKKSF